MRVRFRTARFVWIVTCREIYEQPGSSPVKYVLVDAISNHAIHGAQMLPHGPLTIVKRTTLAKVGRPYLQLRMPWVHRMRYMPGVQPGLLFAELILSDFAPEAR